MPTFKVAFLGEGRVGKTSISLQRSEDRFEQTIRSTVAAAFFQKTVTTKSERAINIMLWDTAGQEEVHSLAPIYYKDTHAALLVYSVVDQPSFDRMVQWRNELISSRGVGRCWPAQGTNPDARDDQTCFTHPDEMWWRLRVVPHIF
jgi:small GTP-binding protein